ncbi:MAG: 16S rRNA (cytidine(1402)-2'-O)-methyltransferase [Syntrophomonadaceae bacterium]|nr:16S rRNA (cytidine(1402)-2'-O)-methyltransferase [Syntrophomonadaceae bacterium]
MSAGELFICATPIGNLEDASFRLIDTLNKADIIVCEDTRHTIKLLNHYKIKKKLVSYHDYSSAKKEDYIINKIKEGLLVALVTDAGMPGISDPGQVIVDKAMQSGLKVDIIPGPSAVTTALIASGFSGYAFIFAGFLNRKPGKRREEIKKFEREEKAVILYEAPHRLIATLEDIEMVLGAEREIAVARELTKINQEVIRGPCGQILRHFEANAPKGEICVIIAGWRGQNPEINIKQVVSEIKIMLDEGIDKKSAFKIKALEYKIPKSVIYKAFIDEST